MDIDSPIYLSANLNTDGIVNFNDLARIAQWWGPQDCVVFNDRCDGADITHSTAVDCRIRMGTNLYSTPRKCGGLGGHEKDMGGAKGSWIQLSRRIVCAVVQVFIRFGLGQAAIFLSAHSPWFAD